MPDFRLLVFDWDGTLMDSAARIVSCMRSAMRDAGLDPADERSIRNIIGLGLSEALDTLMPGLGPERRGVLVAAYRHYFLAADPTPARLFPGAAETLHSLRAEGYLLGIATGKSRRGLARSLAETGLAGLFDSTRCADEAASKPSPDMLLEIMADLDVAPADTLMIGDTEYDLLMARHARAHALAVSYGVHERERLLACAPLACLDSIADVATWLRAAREGVRARSP